MANGVTGKDMSVIVTSVLCKIKERLRKDWIKEEAIYRNKSNARQYTFMKYKFCQKYDFIL